MNIEEDEELIEEDEELIEELIEPKVYKEKYLEW